MQKPCAMEAQEPSLRAGCTVMTGNAESGNILRRPFTETPLKLNFQAQKSSSPSVLPSFVGSVTLATLRAWFREGSLLAVTVGAGPLL